ncbi:MAG: hypothetical protein LC799_32475 [Actinobacteria bacterium]|nr:hypothetical protein [Actinomycetota bacterium]
MTLSAAEHFEWLALRRVNRGGMTRCGTGFVDFGQPLGEFLAEVVGELVEQDLLEVGEVSPRDGLARVWHTDTGQARYAELCRKQHRPAPRSAG